MQTKSTHLRAAPDIPGTASFPWQHCPISALVDRCCDLEHEIADALPRGEYRLRDHLRRSLLNLKRRAGLAAGEHEGSRYLALIENAIRDAQDLSLWLWECVRRNLGPPNTARSAWSLLERVFQLLREKHSRTLVPYHERAEAFAALPLAGGPVNPPPPQSETIHSGAQDAAPPVQKAVEPAPRTHRSPSRPARPPVEAAPFPAERASFPLPESPPQPSLDPGAQDLSTTPSTIPSPAPPPPPKRRCRTRARRAPLDVQIAVL